MNSGALLYLKRGARWSAIHGTGMQDKPGLVIFCLKLKKREPRRNEREGGGSRVDLKHRLALF